MKQGKLRVDERMYFKIHDLCKNAVGGKSAPSGNTTRWNFAMGSAKNEVIKVRGSY